MGVTFPMLGHEVGTTDGLEGSDDCAEPRGILLGGDALESEGLPSVDRASDEDFGDSGGHGRYPLLGYSCNVVILGAYCKVISPLNLLKSRIFLV